MNVTRQTRYLCKEHAAGWNVSVLVRLSPPLTPYRQQRQGYLLHRHEGILVHERQEEYCAVS
jgi:hypothetical protein